MHEMHLNHEPFLAIKNGTKTIELRLLDEKRRNIRVNDFILFKDRLTHEEIQVCVIGLHIYPNFSLLYKHFDPIALGYSKDENALAEDMEVFYPIESQEKYGVVGIEIALIKSL